MSETGPDSRRSFLKIASAASALVPRGTRGANDPDYVRSRKRPNSGLETCVRSSYACLLGNASYRSRLRLDWDDNGGRVEQDAARPYLEREYRPPWKLEA